MATWVVKHGSNYLDVWGGPALPGAKAQARWVRPREDATTFSRLQDAYAAAGQHRDSRVVRVVPRRARRWVQIGDVLIKPPECVALRAIGGEMGSRSFTVAEFPKWEYGTWGLHGIRLDTLWFEDGRTQPAMPPKPLLSESKEP